MPDHAFLKEAEEILRHLHGYRPDATAAPAKAFDHDRHLLAAKLIAVSTRQPEPAEPELVVDPDMIALIKWRDRCALDWWGAELVLHVAHILKYMHTRDVPQEYREAHNRFLAMDGDVQVEIVGAVLGWGDEHG